MSHKVVMEGPRLMGASVKARPEKEDASCDALEHDLQKWKPFSEEIVPHQVSPSALIPGGKKRPIRVKSSALTMRRKSLVAGQKLRRIGKRAGTR
jgi:hypothetical protein